VLGRTVRLDRRFEIIGVAPRFWAFDTRQVHPADGMGAWATGRARYFVSTRLYGRLAPGATKNKASPSDGPRAAVYLRATARRFLDRSGHVMRVATVSSSAGARQNLVSALRGALFVLLIGCVNVANLLLVGPTHGAPNSVRSAQGRPRPIARQLLVERHAGRAGRYSASLWRGRRLPP
jgi:putative ABC transport system permease protein